MTYKTEYEAWQAILDVLEGYGMPPYIYANGTDSERNCDGLCNVIDQMCREGKVSWRLSERMISRIYKVPSKCKEYSAYLAPPYQAKPRISYVRQFMEECK